MTDRPPKKWRSSVDLDTKISSLASYSRCLDGDSTVPKEVDTVSELLHKRCKMSSEFVGYTRVEDTDSCDTLSHLFEIEYEDTESIPECIDSVVDFRLSLFALASSGTVYDSDGEESNVDETFGRDIHDAICSHRVTAVSREEDTMSKQFKFPNARTPESVIYPCAINEYYVLTTADIQDDSSLLVDCIDEDEESVAVSSVLLHRIQNLFSFSSFEELISNVQIVSDMPVSIREEQDGIYAFIAPIKPSSINYSDEPWSEINSISDYSVVF